MARIAGVDLPRNKQARIALTYIYGIGNPRSLKILEKAKVDAFKKVQDLGEEEVNRIRQVIEDEGDVEGDLRKDDPDAHQAPHRYPELPWQPASPRRCRYADSAPTPTPAPARDPRKGTIAGKKKATAKT